jgi:hypothetical protein
MLLTNFFVVQSSLILGIVIDKQKKEKPEPSIDIKPECKFRLQILNLKSEKNIKKANTVFLSYG